MIKVELEGNLFIQTCLNGFKICIFLHFTPTHRLLHDYWLCSDVGILSYHILHTNLHRFLILGLAVLIVLFFHGNLML